VQRAERLLDRVLGCVVREGTISGDRIGSGPSGLPVTVEERAGGFG
jgi:hypothetical protein